MCFALCWAIHLRWTCKILQMRLMTFSSNSKRNRQVLLLTLCSYSNLHLQAHLAAAHLRMMRLSLFTRERENHSTQAHSPKSGELQNFLINGKDSMPLMMDLLEITTMMGNGWTLTQDKSQETMKQMKTTSMLILSLPMSSETLQLRASTRKASPTTSSLS